MAEKKPDKSARPGCNCRAAKDSKYCSEYCGMVAINTCPSPASAGIRSVLLVKRWAQRDSSIAKPLRSLQVCHTGMPTTCTD